MKWLGDFVCTRTFAIAWLLMIVAMYAGSATSAGIAIPLFQWINFILAGYLVGFAISTKLHRKTIDMLLEANNGLGEFLNELKETFAKLKAEHETVQPNQDGTCNDTTDV